MELHTWHKTGARYSTVGSSGGEREPISNKDVPRLIENFNKLVPVVRNVLLGINELAKEIESSFVHLRLEQLFSL